MATFLITGVRCYQWVSAVFMKPCCRYVPTCSQYMIESLQKKSVLRGVLQGLHRILRCHPWGGHGFDPVP